ncbi:hypothetical protein FWF89_02370 [Candidatus Saccharibacteria bacterium]|nr:hypothetical protein [Candidatus Saccharibacteria bacterium]
MNKAFIINMICVAVIVASGVGMGVMLPGVIDKFNKEEVAQRESEDKKLSDGQSEGSDSNCANMPPIAGLMREEALDILKTSLTGEKFYVMCDFAPKNIGGAGVAAIYFGTAGDNGKLNKVAGPDILSRGLREVIETDRSDSRYVVTRGKEYDSDKFMVEFVTFNEKDLSFQRFYDGHMKEKTIFLNKERSYVEDTLRIFARASTAMYNVLLFNLYSYEMAETDEMYEFKYYFVGMGLNYEIKGAYNYSYEVTLEQVTFRVDRSTGELSGAWYTDQKKLKAFVLSDEEGEEIMNMLKVIH